MNIAVIPCRGGSKRIPRKNIRDFNGRPVMAWPIATAIESGLFSRVVVSTDDEDIADVALRYGAEVPFRRPAELADDYTSVGDVMRHAVLSLSERHEDINAVCCIYATAPMLTVGALESGLAILEAAGWDYVFSATEFPSSIFRGFLKDSTGLEMVFPEHRLTRSQDLPTVFHDAGQFYWGRAAAWEHGLPVFGSGSTIVPLPRWNVQDIDNEEDWRVAELLHQIMLTEQSGEQDQI